MTGWNIDPATGQPYPFFQGSWTGNPPTNAFDLAQAGQAGFDWFNRPFNWALNTQPQTGFERTLDATLNVPKAVDATLKAYQKHIGQPFVEFLHGKPQQVSAAPVPAQVPQAQVGPAPQSGFTIPGQFIDYTRGLPTFGLGRASVPVAKEYAGDLAKARPQLPDAPEYTGARAAMKAAAPGKYEDQPWVAKDSDALWSILPGVLAGLAGEGSLGQNLLRSAAAGFQGKAQFKAQQRQDKKEFSKEEKEYQRWLTTNELNMSQSQFENALRRSSTGFEFDKAIADAGRGDFQNKLSSAQLQHSINAASAQLGLEGAKLKYEAELKQQEQMMPKLSGSNLISRGPDGSYTIKNVDPMHGLYLQMLSGGNGGALPASAYSTKNLLANLPMEARTAISPMIAEIQKDPSFVQMVSGLGGAELGDIAILNQLQMRLQKAAQAGDANSAAALMQINQAFAKGALMNKMKVE